MTATKNAELRLDFISRLEAIGIDIRSQTFSTHVDKCFHYYFDSIAHISSNEMALSIWQKAARRPGESTRLIQSGDVVLDGDVPG